MGQAAETLPAASAPTVPVTHWQEATVQVTVPSDFKFMQVTYNPLQEECVNWWEIF